jgi:sulfoxide reductase heme-binding subunit YedZ
MFAIMAFLLDPARALWRDRRNDFSPLKASVLAALAAPALAVAVAGATGGLGAEPVERAQDEAGRWALRFLLLSLAVTPLRLLWRWNRLILVRRMIGVAALLYATAHLAAHVALEDWRLAAVAGEIATRVYLTLGAAALAGLVVLGATSTDNAVRRLGAARWQALHRASYPIAVLAVTHFFLQTRLDPSEAFVVSGLLAWLLTFRVLRWTTGAATPAAALAVAAGVTVAVALGEAVFFHLRFDAPLASLLAANLQTGAGVRPAWIVGGVTLAVAATGGVRRRAPRPAHPRAAAG